MSFQISNFKFQILSRDGIISLTTVLIIGTIVMETALVGLAVAYLVGEQGAGVKMSYNAALTARSGFNDVLLKIERNKDYVLSSYTLPVGGYIANISGTKSALDSRFNQYVVSIIGTALDKQVKIVGTIVVDGFTGAIISETTQEVSVN